MTGDDLRIRDGVARGPAIRFLFDGREIAGCEGESVAAALWAAGIRGWTSDRAEGPPARTAFCAMGICKQCVLWVDGVRGEACCTPVRAGLDVRTRR